jgi:glycosyltransferase involved in cell wall biosynthesis
MAGSFAYLAFKDRMQVYIESFEPHAEYMLASGIWKKYDPRYLLQRRMEKAQKDTAAGIMTVSESYRKQLISEGISPGRVRAVPCAVKPDLYAYNPAERASTRLKLAISDHEIAGIYAGKLGGLYYMRQALQCFATIYSRLENFRLILLTYHDHREIIQGLASRGVPRELYTIEKVSPQQVPAYLSAADFGFCFHRSHDYSKAFGPVKNGEYWASGLPIMIPGNIGDDSDIAVSENAGATFSVNDTQSIADGISKIQDIIREPSSRKRIGEIAIKYKSFSTVSAAYQYFLNTKNQSNNA